MYYALLGSNTVPVYEYYTDEDGNKYPIETGAYKTPYLAPVPFSGNIVMSGGESEASEFGLNLADYEAVLLVEKNNLPITETSLIWRETEVSYNADGTPDESTADYRVIKVSPSLNSDKYILKQVVK